MPTDGRPPVGANAEQLSKIFSQALYFEIPRFQRSYAWDYEQYSDFWSDITHAQESGRSHIHFLGAMVFARNVSRPSLFVLDGQQRLTTLMLLIGAMHKNVINPQSEPLKLLVEDLSAALRVTVPIEDHATRVMRLHANRQDREYFEGLISNGTPGEVRHDSHSIMKKAYEYFTKEIQALSDDEVERWTRINQLWNTIRNQFWYIHIVCEEEINAQVVFESLNAKGEDLSSADLIKNYLFMEIEQSRDSDIDEADRKWSEMVSVLGRDTNLPDYVHAFWTSKYAYSRLDEIYPELKKRVHRNAGNVWQFLRELRDEADTYDEIRNPSDEYWSSPATSRMFREMKALNIRITRPVLLALWSVLKGQPKVFEAHVKVLLNFMIRYSKVSERPSNTIDGDFSQWARDIRERKQSPDDFDAWLKRKSPSREQFIENFKTWKVKNGPTARLILMKLNNALNEGGEPEAMIADGEKVTLEHVIPKAPNDAWTEYLMANDIVLDDVLHRVGNLTLLTQPKNSYASNREFIHKRDNVYTDSGYPITKDLLLSLTRDAEGKIDLKGPRRSLDEFGLSELSIRQERLAELAERIWSLD